MALPHAGLADDGAFTWVKPQDSLVEVISRAAGIRSWYGWS